MLITSEMLQISLPLSEDWARGRVGGGGYVKFTGLANGVKFLNEIPGCLT